MNDDLKDMTYGEQLEYLDAYIRLLTEGFRQCDKIHSKMRFKRMNKLCFGVTDNDGKKIAEFKFYIEGIKDDK